MKLMLLVGLAVTLLGCNTLNKLGGNELGVSYSAVTIGNQETVYPEAKKHCAKYSKKEKLIKSSRGTFIFECH